MGEQSTHERSVRLAHDVAHHLLGVFPELDQLDQRLSIALYRELARGAPVPPSLIASRIGAPVANVIRRLANWPGLYHDKHRRIIGYWGLTIVPTRHKLRIEDRDLYAWCAWDTLFLPALLGARAEVQSTCRATGTPVRLTIGLNAVEAASPANLGVSFVLPDANGIRSDVIASFCRHVHFFRSPQLAQLCHELPPSAFVLTLTEAFEAGRARNRGRYWAVSELLGAPAEAR
jgi:alkylmercury lyase